MTNYYLILYKYKGNYSFCYNGGPDEQSIRNYWSVNHRDTTICNLKQVPDDKVEDFRKYIKNKKGLRFKYSKKNGDLFLEKFNVNFWS